MGRFSVKFGNAIDKFVNVYICTKQIYHEDIRRYYYKFVSDGRYYSELRKHISEYYLTWDQSDKFLCYYRISDNDLVLLFVPYKESLINMIKNEGYSIIDSRVSKSSQMRALPFSHSLLHSIFED